jgi:DHA2 family multidrug resistance protein
MSENTLHQYPQGATRWIIVVTVITAAILELLNTSIVNVALKDISGNLGATPTEVAWVITSYAIANVIIIPLAGFLADLFGRKNYFTASIALFTFASFMCGNSHSIDALIFWRVLQGLGGGALLPTSQTVLVETFPPEQLSTANAVFGLGIVLGPAFGPTLGGYLTDAISWQWIFLINIPIGVTASILSSIYVFDSKTSRKDKAIDWMGILFLIIGIGALQYVLEEGQTDDWFESNSIRLFTALTVVGCALFIWWELRVKNPVVNLRVLRHRSVALGSALNLVFGIGIYAPLFLFPLFAQTVLGWSASQTGLMLLPGAIMSAVCIAASGRLMSKGVSPKLFITAGFCCFIVFSIMMYFSSSDSGFRNFDVPHLLRGMTNGLILTPIAVLSLAGLKGNDIAQSAGITNMIRQLGGAVGVAIANILLAQKNPLHRIDLLGNISEYNTVAQERAAFVTQGLMNNGLSAEQAHDATVKILDITVNRQTAVLSFNESFFIFGLIFLVTMPLIFMIKSQKGSANIVAH